MPYVDGLIYRWSEFGPAKTTSDYVGEYLGILRN